MKDPGRWLRILLGALASFGIWFFWYSKNGFRAAWLRDLYITQAKIDAQNESGLGPTVFYTFVAYFVMAIGIHYWIEATRSVTQRRKFANVFVAWALVSIPVLFLDFLWEFRQFHLLLLDGLHLLIVYFSIAALAPLAKPRA